MLAKSLALEDDGVLILMLMLMVAVVFFGAGDD